MPQETSLLGQCALLESSLNLATLLACQSQLHHVSGRKLRKQEVPKINLTLVAHPSLTTIAKCGIVQDSLNHQRKPFQEIAHQAVDNIRGSAVVYTRIHVVLLNNLCLFAESREAEAEPPQPPPLEIPQTSIDYREGPRVSKYTPQQTPRPPPSRPAPPTRPIRRPVQPIKAQ
ncbi:hypothetical protein B0H34DRAFT_800446 [Crassisporium funariophilum]|nr:hypothetical protein B0H34DRAFT_800446 [Crassisporium funariophilum]